MTVVQKAGSAPRPVFKLVANLPYNVATPIIANLLVHPVLCPDVDGRDDPARAGRPDGRPAVVAGLWCALGPDPGPGRVLDRPRSSPFRLLAPAQGRIGGRHDPARSRTTGQHRRALVPRGRPQGVPASAEEPEARACGHMAATEWTKAEVDAWLASLGLDGQIRAEALDVDQFRSLAQALKQRWGHESGTGLAPRMNSDRIYATWPCSAAGAGWRAAGGPFSVRRSPPGARTPHGRPWRSRCRPVRHERFPGGLWARSTVCFSSSRRDSICRRSSRLAAVTDTSIAWVSWTASRQTCGSTPLGLISARGSITGATWVAPKLARARYRSRQSRKTTNRAPRA